MLQMESYAKKQICQVEFTISQRKGSVLRFQSNSTATSEDRAQKIGNNLLHDSE